MRRSSLWVSGIVLATLGLLGAPALRAEPQGLIAPGDNAAVALPQKFMRFVDDGRAGGSFQTADVTFRNKEGAVVRLVSAIHIGEKAYYESLNKSFENDDAVLYELVRPKEGGLPQKGQASDNPINQFQHMLKDVLNLDFQLDDIDYNKPNFVHADMDAETFTRLQRERGESFEQLMLKQLLKAFSPGDDQDKQGKDEDLDPHKVIDQAITMLTRPDMERQIKLVVARQLDQMDTKAMGLDDANGSVILTERNKVALKTLDATLGAGKKRVSVFYGAAHMPDMSRRLGEMGFTPVAVDWRTAWDLRIRYEQPSAAEKLLRELFNSFDGSN